MVTDKTSLVHLISLAWESLYAYLTNILRIVFGLIHEWFNTWLKVLVLRSYLKKSSGRLLMSRFLDDCFCQQINQQTVGWDLRKNSWENCRPISLYTSPQRLQACTDWVLQSSGDSPVLWSLFFLIYSSSYLLKPSEQVFYDDPVVKLHIQWWSMIWWQEQQLMTSATVDDKLQLGMTVWYDDKNNSWWQVQQLMTSYNLAW